MVTGIVILCAVLFFLGMFTSVKCFGTGGKRANIFKDIYFSVEQINGIGVIYSKYGEYSAVLKMENPIQKYSADIDSYYSFVNLMTDVLETLGEGYALHKQDVFSRKKFRMPVTAASNGEGVNNYLQNSYFRFFNGRPYTSMFTYLVITQENKKGSVYSWDESRWKDFLSKTRKVYDQLKDNGIKCELLDDKACREYTERFFTMDFSHKTYSMTDLSVDNEEIRMGNRQTKVYSLLDVDQCGLPGVVRPYTELSVNNITLPVDLLSDIDSIPDADTVVYNQVIFLPHQRPLLNSLDKKKNRHASIPNPSNKVTVEDIKAVQDVIAREDKQLVYAHYNLIVTTSVKTDMTKITNYLENSFMRHGIKISRRAYNQLELFVASFPGNCFRLNKDYDRFLTLSEPALCLMYKEHQMHGDEGSSLKCYYTDRQGVPLVVDTTGKEGKVRYTDNSNFFVLGPSGSGKSFFMNTVMRQYYEQNTDIVIVDTGDSYEGLCEYFNGTYITYSKEHPISMNPFKMTPKEYDLNFTEKKDFIKNLIFLIFKGNQAPTKLEDTIIDQTIVEYFDAYFHPFKGFTPHEREQQREILRLQDKKNGDYYKYEDEMERKFDEQRYDDEDIDLYDEEIKNSKLDDQTAEHLRRYVDHNERIIEKLRNLASNEAASEGERQNALRQIHIRLNPEEKKELMLITPEVIKKKYRSYLDKRIDKIEKERQLMKVHELSFNSYYEYAIERIPQIMRDDKVEFNINDFAKILKPFYRGGNLEYTLNNDMDKTLFDEKFIVFEIDKIKEDPVLFPIITLIIMDVFTQKMRIKKGRKCLVIEEAWKAIATPTMANYIKYLYKTARKHWAMVGVVTQEIEDIISSDIVKNAIISNSGVFMLLDQSKFMDKFDDIKSTLALSDIDCRKIFTINRLDNKEGRSAFKEVFIKRGVDGQVFGVEEPRECYMTYTTEKAEKEALKLYKKLLNCDHASAIKAFVRDWNNSGIKKSFDFAKKVLTEKRILNIPDPETGGRKRPA